MFEWLKGHWYYGEDFDDGKILDINLDTKKVIVEGVLENDYENVIQREIDFCGSGIHFQFDQFDGWKEKLYKKLLETGSLEFRSLSTESGDRFDFTVRRLETSLEFSYAKNITIVNYFIEFCNEIRDFKSKYTPNIFALNKDDESQENFVKWIEEVKEIEPMFNDSECNYKTMRAVTFEDSQITDKEYDVIAVMHRGE